MKDQIGRHIIVSDFPTKIVSVVPSITELLCALVERNRIIGRTKFCIHPQPVVSNIAKIGGTKNIDIEAVKTLSPDLILANKEENNKEQIEELALNFPVYVSDVNDIPSCKFMIRDISKLTDKQTEAVSIIAEIENIISMVNPSPRNCLYLIWSQPYMCAGNDTYISAMLEATGFHNIIDVARYPEITIDQINDLKPELILLSSEPYPFKKKHAEALLAQLNYKPSIKLVDGEMFSWYGVRTAYGLNYGRSLRKTIA